MMNKPHHLPHHPTQPQPPLHLPTQQLLKLHPQAIHHHLNLATQLLNLPLLHPILPQNHLINQVITNNNHHDKVVS